MKIKAKRDWVDKAQSQFNFKEVQKMYRVEFFDGSQETRRFEADNEAEVRLILARQTRETTVSVAILRYSLTDINGVKRYEVDKFFTLE